MDSLYDAIKQTLGPLGRDVLLTKAAILTNQGSIILNNLEENSHLVQVVKKTLKNLVDGKAQFVILSYHFMKAIKSERRNIIVLMMEKLYFTCFDRIIIEPFTKIAKKDENAAEMLASTALCGKYTKEKIIELVEIAGNAANHDFSHRNLELIYENIEAIYVGDAIKLVKGNLIRGQVSKIFSDNRLNPKIIIIPSRDLIPVSIETDFSNLFEYSFNLHQELLMYLEENYFSVAILDSSTPLWVKDSFWSLKTTVLEAAHPDDIKRLILSSCEYLSESKFGFTLNLSSYEVISNLWGVYLILEYPEAPPTLILPENQLSKYEFEAIKKVIGIWKQWSIDYLVIPGGGIFEAIVSWNLHEFPLLQAIFRNYLRILYENCSPAFQEPEKTWREFLVNLLSGTPKSIQVDLEDGNAVLEDNPKTVESLNLK